VKRQYADSSSLIEVIESKNQLKSSDLLPGVSLFKFKCEEKQASIRSSDNYFKIIEFENGIKEILLLIIIKLAIKFHRI
jgi:hypothetical protein